MLFADGGERVLSSAKQFLSDYCDYFELVFDPDVVIETVHLGESVFQTKGGKARPITTRRGGI